jgi:hypothetical protein
MGDESPGVHRLAGQPAQVLLHLRERAGEADRDDPHAPPDRHQVQPQRPPPSPGHKSADRDEAKDGDVRRHHEICQ